MTEESRFQNFSQAMKRNSAKIAAFVLCIIFVFLIVFFCLPGVSFMIIPDKVNKDGVKTPVQQSALEKTKKADDGDSIYLINKAIQTTIVTVLMGFIIAQQIWNKELRNDKYTFLRIILNSFIVFMIIFLIASPVDFLYKPSKYKESKGYKNNEKNTGNTIIHLIIITFSCSIMVALTRGIIVPGERQKLMNWNSERVETKEKDQLERLLSKYKEK